VIKKLTHASIYVADVDEALTSYTEIIGFEKRNDMLMEDGNMGKGARWVSVGPTDQPDVEVVLQQTFWGPEEMTPEERAALVGKNPGFVLEVDNMGSSVNALKAKGVEFTMEIMEFSWGKQASFKDLYGNVHVLSQPTE